MSLADILNTDLDVISLRLRDGFAWWINELGAMAAPAVSKVRREVKLTAERRADGRYLVRSPGHADRVHAAGSATVSAALVMPEAAVLTRTLALAALPDRDIRRMLALDLDRLTPFTAQSAYHDIQLGPPPAAGGKRQVRLAVVPRVLADAAVAEAQAAGVAPTAVIARGAGAEVFDFLPAMRAAGAPSRNGRLNLYLWAAVGVLLAANIGLAIWRDAQDVDRLQAQVASQEPLVERIRLLQLQSRAHPAQAQAAARAAGEPLRVLAALSQALPQEAWVQRLSWDGASVRIVGLRRGGVDVVGVLRQAPLFTNVRDADASTSSTDGFDVIADVAPPATGAGR